MRVIDLETGLRPEEEIKGDIPGTISALVGGRWKIQTTIRYEGKLCYVCTGVFAYRGPRNEVATQIVKQICWGTIVLVEKGRELP